VTECPSPASTWWFTGAGATLDHSSELVLSNLDPGPAVMDIRVFGPDGEIETIGTRGITVPPEEQTTVALTDVAPQGNDLAVSVVSSRGRLVAAVSDTFAPGFVASPGDEWIPAQVSPSRMMRLAGLPGKADGHTLVLANPSDLEALVDVGVSGETGSFTPTEGAQVGVPPGSVVSTDLTKTIGGRASAVTLRSTVPVTATVRSVVGAASAYAGSVHWLTGPAIAPVVASGPALCRSLRDSSRPRRRWRPTARAAEGSSPRPSKCRPGQPPRGRRAGGPPTSSSPRLAGGSTVR